MADGRVEIDIELRADQAEAQASKAGKAAGEEFSSGVEKGVKGASSSIDSEVGKTVPTAKAEGRKAGQGYGDEFTSAAESSLGGLSGVVASAAGALAVGDLFSSSIEAANDFGEDMGKLGVAFSQAGYSAEAAKGVYGDFVGILGETDQSVEAANHLAKLAKSEDELSQWTNIAAGVYAEFGDSLPLEGLTEAANETAKVAQVTGPLADALNWAGVAEDDFNAKLAELATEEERAAYITDTLSGLYSEAGEAYLDTNAAIVEYRQSQSDVREGMSDLGEALMPVASAFSEWAASMLEQVVPVVQAFVDNLPAIVDQFVKWSPVVAAVAAGVAGFAIAMNFSAIVGAATTALNGAKAAVLGLNAAMKANPIGIVIGLVSALVAALVALWATNDDFRAAVTAAWENVKQVASDVWGAVIEFFTVTVPNAVQALFDWFSQIPGKVQGFLESALARVAEFAAGLAAKAADAGSRFVSNVVGFVSSLPEKARAQLDLVISRVTSWASGLVSRGADAASSFVSNVVGFVSSLPGRLGDMLSSAASRAASFASDFASSAFDGASRFVSNIVSALSGLPDRVYSIGSNIVSGIWSGISGMVGWMRDRLFGFADSVLGGIKSALGIASPSKVMRDEVGRWMAEGIYVGFEENDPMGQITASVSRGVTQLGIMAQMAAAGGTAYSQTVNFNQPVQSPDEFARAMRMQQRYGLAGAYV